MEYVEIARAESGRGQLVLRERRDARAPTVLELRANGLFVMDTFETGTERALATAALGLVRRPRAVLVGGLGLGFTVREVLAERRVERCTVVEIEPALVAWMRDGTVPDGPALLADPRVRVVVGDVAEEVAAARPATLDLVLLDVDNGPEHLVHARNARLYRRPFLTAARAVLRPGGALAIWSADEAPGLVAAMRDVFADAEARPLPVRLAERAEHYWLYVARVPSPT